MAHAWETIRRLLSSDTPATETRRTRELTPRLDGLEERVVLSPLGMTGGRRGAGARFNRSAQVARMGRTAAASAQAARAAAAAATATQTDTTSETATDTTATQGTCTPGTMTEAGTAALPADLGFEGMGPGGFRGGRGGGPGRGGFGDMGRPAPIDEQLAEHMNQLRTDMESVLSGSAVTDAQRLALSQDLRVIADAGLRLDPTKLQPIADTLLTAVADGTYDSNAETAASIRTSFDALFTDSSVDSTVIDKTYNDLVAVAKGLNLSTEELNTLTADRAAIAADLERLGIDTTDHPGPQGPSSNLEFLLAPGFGHFRGRRR